MFEKETQFIADYITNKLKNTGSSITFEKLSEFNIHPAVLKYISSEIDYLIYEDRKKLLANSLFDYSGKEIAKYFSLITAEIKKSKKISIDDVKKLILQAVAFNLNFVTHPKWSLVKHVFFNEEHSKRIEEVELLLNHIYYYNYLKNIILSYAAKRKLEVLSAIEFDLILDKIDKELFIAQGTKLVENALLSMSEFINYGTALGSKISLKPVEIFLKEKNEVQFLFRLRRALPIEGSRRYDIEEIKKIIFAATPADIPISAFDTEKEPIQENIEEPFSESLQESKKEPLPEPLQESIEEPVEHPIEDFNEEPIEQWLEDLNEEPIQESDDEPVQETKPLEEETDDVVDQPTDELTDEPIPPEEEQVFSSALNISTPENDDILKIYDEELKSLEELERRLSINAEDLKNTELYEFEEESEETEIKQIQDELLGSDEFLVTGENADIPVDSKERLEHIADAEEDIKVPTEKSKFSFFKKKEAEPKDEPEHEEKDKKDIFTFFTNKEMDRIVGAVFNADRDDFLTTMEKISECTSYDDATEIIKGVFLTYRINPYSRDAVSLTNAVANYFNQG